MRHSLPKLSFAYDALEPHIDAKTMEIHHTKHHQGYVNNLNKTLEKFSEWQQKSLEELLSNIDSIPEEIRTAVRNNGGGHFNHSLYWSNMKPSTSGSPGNELFNAIKNTFTNFAQFKKTFAKAATTRFGSGWAWLAVNKDKLEIYSTPNQDNPVMEGKTPILGLDVWEHAYYLKYQNKRDDYINNWWNVVNWEAVEGLYNKAVEKALKEEQI